MLGMLTQSIANGRAASAGSEIVAGNVTSEAPLPASYSSMGEIVCDFCREHEVTLIPSNSTLQETSATFAEMFHSCGCLTAYANIESLRERHQTPPWNLVLFPDPVKIYKVMLLWESIEKLQEVLQQTSLLSSQISMACQLSFKTDKFIDVTVDSPVEISRCNVLVVDNEDAVGSRHEVAVEEHGRDYVFRLWAMGNQSSICSQCGIIQNHHGLEWYTKVAGLRLKVGAVHEVDIAVGGLSVFYFRFLFVDFVYPYITDVFAFVSKAPTRLPLTQTIIYPFQQQVWMALFASLLVAWAGVIILRRWTPRDKLVGDAPDIWLLFATLVRQSDWGSEFRTLSFRCLLAAWLLLSLVASNSYSCLLLSFMSVPAFSPHVDTPERLQEAILAGKYTAGTSNGTAQYTLIMETREGPLAAVRSCMLRDSNDLVPNKQVGLDRAVSHNYAYIDTQRGLSAALLERHNTSIEVSTGHIGTTIMSLAMHKTCFYRNAFSTADRWGGGYSWRSALYASVISLKECMRSLKEPGSESAAARLMRPQALSLAASLPGFPEIAVFESERTYRASMQVRASAIAACSEDSGWDAGVRRRVAMDWSVRSTTATVASSPLPYGILLQTVVFVEDFCTGLKARGMVRNVGVSRERLYGERCVYVWRDWARSSWSRVSEADGVLVTGMLVPLGVFRLSAHAGRAQMQSSTINDSPEDCDFTKGVAGLCGLGFSPEYQTGLGQSPYLELEPPCWFQVGRLQHDTSQGLAQRWRDVAWCMGHKAFQGLAETSRGRRQHEFVLFLCTAHSSRRLVESGHFLKWEREDQPVQPKLKQSQFKTIEISDVFSHGTILIAGYGLALVALVGEYARFRYVSRRRLGRYQQRPTDSPVNAIALLRPRRAKRTQRRQSIKRSSSTVAVAVPTPLPPLHPLNRPTRWETRVVGQSGFKRVSINLGPNAFPKIDSTAGQLPLEASGAGGQPRRDDRCVLPNFPTVSTW
ncbi:hypothetical protein HPB51_009612 [Rhipicephalus microplus]|uniref:Ionotropic glutamate receptor C-terminal domain-containing protein n=1 Tax=Rhipicephalus microplus TaxID=6941 RepID=A0A9J6DMC9_RHIMP|nr:hypothetical protein HPB51_009612 [Rhipicephalus microplus]